MRKSKSIVLTLAGISAFTIGVLVACEGPEGPQGPQGLAAAAGSAQQGPAGPTGPAGAVGPQGEAPDGGLTTSCMMPCHGFGGIVEQWKTSTHYFGAITNSDEEGPWTTANNACGNCHATDGLPTRLAGQYTLPQPALDGGPTNALAGELNYAKAAGGTQEIGYGGHAPLAIINCTTCHDAFANDPHLTGGNYTKGEFKLRVAAGANDQVVLEKSPSVGAPTGTQAGKWGTSNTCIACHKSRKDVTNYITASNTLSSATWGPHEGPHSDIFTGLGGYHFTGKNYVNSTHQTTAGCTTCHMGKVAANGNYPNHTFIADKATCSSNGCHGTGASFTAQLNAATGLYNAAMTDLQRVLNNLGILTRATTSPNSASPILQASELADKQFTLDRVRNPGSAVSADIAGALYNYLLVARGSALMAHNPNYTKQLIFDSYVAAKGGGDPATPAGIPTRP